MEKLKKEISDLMAENLKGLTVWEERAKEVAELFHDPSSKKMGMVMFGKPSVFHLPYFHISLSADTYEEAIEKLSDARSFLRNKVLEYTDKTSGTPTQIGGDSWMIVYDSVYAKIFLVISESILPHFVKKGCKLEELTFTEKKLVCKV